MSISSEQIDHLAHLARLDLKAEEKKKYQKDISAILKYVEKIQKIHEERQDYLVDAGPKIKIGRTDAITACPLDEREAIISAFPEREGNLAKVKGVFE